MTSKLMESNNREQTDRTDFIPSDKSKVVKTNTSTEMPREIGGSDGPEPTRYGDWEKNGRCSDF